MEKSSVGMMGYSFIYRKKGVTSRDVSLAASEHCVHCKDDTSLMYFHLSSLHVRDFTRSSVLIAFLDTVLKKLWFWCLLFGWLVVVFP